MSRFATVVTMVTTVAMVPSFRWLPGGGPLAAQAVSSPRGLLRRADSAYAAGDRRRSAELYGRVLAEDPDQSRAVFRLAQLAATRQERLALYTRYTELEPRDPWGFLALGDAYHKAGRERSALGAYRAAARLAPSEPDVVARLGPQRHRVSPALEPIASYQRDSDANAVRRVGLRADLQAGEMTRLGAQVQRASVSGAGEATVDEALARIGTRGPGLRVDLLAGAARLASPLTPSAFITPSADGRLQWRAPSGGPAVELRAQRLVLGASPLLVANRVTRNEARFGLDFPAGPIRLRGTGRVGMVEALGESANRRLQGDGMIVLPIGDVKELSLQYHRLGYQRASLAGYFAPARVETIEGGTYLEFGERVVLAMDLVAGAQRLATQGAGVGPWRLALRSYAYVALPLGPTTQLRLEGEAYKAPFAPEGAVTAENWRYGSLSLALRWAL